MKLALFSLAVCAIASTTHAQTPPIDTTVDLQLRHAEMFDDPSFSDFAKRFGIGAWNESGTPGSPQINVQSKSGDKLFVGEFEKPDGEKLEKSRILDLTRFDAIRRGAVDEVLGEFPTSKIDATTPTAILTPGGYDFAWRIETINSVKQTFWYSTAGRVGAQTVHLPALQPSAPAVPCDGRDDSLASDDLHHPQMFEAEARTWIAGVDPLDVGEQARRINLEVHKVQYNVTGLATNEALADVLVGTDGAVCDEYATLLISHLRAVGIPSRMKYLLIEHGNGDLGAHACVEFLVNGVWKHLDPCSGAFDAKDAYRRLRDVVSVRVRDVDQPDDRRSTSPTDPRDDDGILDMYNDFCLTPSNSWEERDGYSRDRTPKP